jgi:hypothetical protein
MHEPYTGTDQIHTTNDSGMEITQIGTTLALRVFFFYMTFLSFSLASGLLAVL